MEGTSFLSRSDEDGMSTTKPSTELATPVVLQTKPAKIEVGGNYRFMTNGSIEDIKVEKIYQDGDKTYVAISRRNTSRGILSRSANVMTLQEFKTRVLVGGVSEIEI